MTSLHDYDADLDTRSYRRLYREESAIAFSALDCVLNGEKGVYASSELTTGERAYAALRERGFRNSSELTEPHRNALLKENLEQASVFARRLRQQLGAKELVITPAPYFAPGWTQAEYLAFWETLIRTRVKAVYFNEGWEFSNGCTFEFAVALKYRVATFDASLRPLSRQEGLERIQKAIQQLQGRGFNPDRLALIVDRLR